MPLIAASTPPTAQVRSTIERTGIPMSWAATGSSVIARIAIPGFVKRKNR